MRAVAPSTFAHVVLDVQRCHWYVNDVAPPVQVPFDAVSSSPTRGVPEIVGFPVFTGAERDETTSVGAEFAVDWPSAFFAVTWTRTVWSASAEVRVYVWLVAPVMSAQPVPSAPQRCHW